MILCIRNQEQFSLPFLLVLALAGVIHSVALKGQKFQELFSHMLYPCALPSGGPTGQIWFPLPILGVLLTWQYTAQKEHFGKTKQKCTDL